MQVLKDDEKSEDVEAETAPHEAHAADALQPSSGALPPEMRNKLIFELLKDMEDESPVPEPAKEPRNLSSQFKLRRAKGPTEPCYHLPFQESLSVRHPAERKAERQARRSPRQQRRRRRRNQSHQDPWMI